MYRIHCDLKCITNNASMTYINTGTVLCEYTTCILCVICRQLPQEPERLAVRDNSQLSVSSLVRACTECVVHYGVICTHHFNTAFRSFYHGDGCNSVYCGLPRFFHHFQVLKISP